MQKWETEGSKRGRVTLSKCQNRGENTERCTHKGRCKFVSVCWQAYVCLPVSSLCVCFFCKMCAARCHMAARGCVFVRTDQAYAASLRMLRMWRMCSCACVGVYDIVSFCKLESHVAGWNPITVRCQHAAVLTWYACYSNSVVKNRLSPGCFSGEFCCFESHPVFFFFYILFLRCCFVIISTVFFSFPCCTGERVDATGVRW